MTTPLPLGDRPTDTSPAARKAVYKELAILTIVTLLLIRGVVALQAVTGLPEWLLAAVPFLFIYAPVALCRLRNVDSFAYRLSIPAFRDLRGWWAGLKDALVLFGIILVPWLIGYHFYYQLPIFAEYAPTPERLSAFLSRAESYPVLGLGVLQVPYWLELCAYQLFFVAIPEEFFYRGYMQTRLNEVFPRKFLLFGIPFGHALWITAIIFAFGHSLVAFRWWHFSIFVPGLLFGLMRERSGAVLAGAFFHAFCNIAVISLDAIYGVSVSP